MPQEYIEIRGARENNLKNVSLRIPKRKITIFTGISGSGKSPIVFDTLANESQRLLSENFSMFLRSFMPHYPQPDADALENLSMAVVVDQKRLGGVRLLATLEALFLQFGIKPGEGDALTKVIRQGMEKARAQLGPAAFESAQQEGHAMTPEQAIALAIENEDEDLPLSKDGLDPSSDV